MNKSKKAIKTWISEIQLNESRERMAKAIRMAKGKIEVNLEKEKMIKRKEKITSRACKVEDFTKGVKEYHSVSKVYEFPSEQDLAKYAITKLVNEFGEDVRCSNNFGSIPTTRTVKTDINQSTVVFQDVFSSMKIKVKAKNGRATTKTVLLQAVQGRESYHVIFTADSKDALEAIENEYLKILEYNNFFQGKTLRFSANGVVFIPCPELTLKEAVLPEKIIKEYKLNILDFLTEPKYHSITKKRALLLYGPPGGGKTTSLKAMFSLLRKKNITCLYLTDATFRNHSLESVFDFINKYLSPCLIGFEDIDLIGEDRSHSKGIIGSLLSVLNGVEDYQKPIAIIGTTNRADILDDAVTRPCRFDRKLKIDYPTTKALRQMFQNMTGKVAPNIIQQSVDNRNKLTGAHIKEICNTAQILAVRDEVKLLDCVEEAFETIKESFYLASSTTGFGSSNEVESDNKVKEAVPLSTGFGADDDGADVAAPESIEEAVEELE